MSERVATRLAAWLRTVPGVEDATARDGGGWWSVDYHWRSAVTGAQGFAHVPWFTAAEMQSFARWQRTAERSGQG